jgi:hypothetical protein
VAIALRNGLPAFPGDDVNFVLGHLRKLGAGTAADIVRGIGLEDRTATGSPTTAYHRIRYALKEALAKGRVEKCGRVWRALAGQGRSP